MLRTKRNIHPNTDVASHTDQYAPRALTSLASAMLVRCCGGTLMSSVLLWSIIAMILGFAVAGFVAAESVHSRFDH
jgi:hypothetical protein